VPVGVGGDVSIDLESGSPSLSGSVSIGPGGPGEAHQLYTTTNTVTVSDIIDSVLEAGEKVYQEIENAEKEFLNDVFDKMSGNWY
jgi:hypothetical protein